MVAFTTNLKVRLKSSLRVRAEDDRCILIATGRSKSNGKACLREAAYDECNRLESCSRDPIGYEAGSNCLYEYCHSKPLKYIDPWGRQIMPIHPMDPSVHTPGLPSNRPTPPHIGICERMAASGTCGGCKLAGCESNLENLIDTIDRVPWTVSWGWETCQRWVLAYPYLNGEDLNSPCFDVEVQHWNVPWPQGFPFTGHAAVKITGCNGEAFYIDNWWLGGDDHIFSPGEIPNIYY